MVYTNSLCLKVAFAATALCLISGELSNSLIWTFFHAVYQKLEYFEKLSIFEYLDKLLTPQFNLMIFGETVFAWKSNGIGKAFSTRTVNRSVIKLKILQTVESLREGFTFFCSTESFLLTEMVISPWIKGRLLLVHTHATQRV